LEREFDLDLITTAPSVVYKVHLRDGTIDEIHSAAEMPDPTKIEKMEEPWIRATIMTPDEFLGSVLDLCTQKRGVQKELTYVGERAMLIYRLPLNEIVYDFYDRLKSCSRGYASFDWQMDGYEDSQLVKLTIMVKSTSKKRSNDRSCF
jgi:GTP-binding protein LepA